MLSRYRTVIRRNFNARRDSIPRGFIRIGIFVGGGEEGILKKKHRRKTR